VTSQPSADAAHAAAQEAFLTALREGADLHDVEAAVRRTTAKEFTPDIAVLEVAVAAMDLAGADRTSPLNKADLVGRHLSEVQFRNQRALQERTTYAINAVAAIRGGLEPDILDDTYWWHVRDIVEYAVLAAVAYVRAGAERRGKPVPEFIDELKSQLDRSEEPPRCHGGGSSPQE
jgi:hypothetical protein